MLLKKYPKLYNLVKKKPVARFYYQGSHTHPVRRTILVIEDTPELIRGYEMREGKEVRTDEEAQAYVKSYRKDRIAKWGDYSRLRQSARTYFKADDQSTLERFPILTIFTEGA